MLKYHQIASRIEPKNQVLDVGCGEGQLAEALAGKGCSVDGIDIDLERLKNRKSLYRNMVCGDFRTINYEDKLHSYDAVVFSDMLEHVENPEAVLKQSLAIIKPGGKVIISLPNVAYISNRIDLLCGSWDYQDEGILDRTHLRFFTLSTARDMIKASGYRIKSFEPVVPVIHSWWKRTIFISLCKTWPSIFAIGWIFEGTPD